MIEDIKNYFSLYREKLEGEREGREGGGEERERREGGRGEKEGREGGGREKGRKI